MVKKCECELSKSKPFRHGIWNPPCILCGVCGRNMVERLEKLGILQKGEYSPDELKRLDSKLQNFPTCDHDSQKVGSWECKACECICDTCGDCSLVLHDNLTSKACTNHICDCHTGKLGVFYAPVK